MAEKKSGEKKGNIGFILGILSILIIPLYLIVLFFGPSVSGIIIGIVGLTFGILQQKERKTKRGKIGIVLNIIGIIIGIIGLIIVVHVLMPIIEQQMQSFPTA